jgi:hypothetical protein
MASRSPYIVTKAVISLLETCANASLSCATITFEDGGDFNQEDTRKTLCGIQKSLKDVVSTVLDNNLGRTQLTPEEADIMHTTINSGTLLLDVLVRNLGLISQRQFPIKGTWQESNASLKMYADLLQILLQNMTP